MEASLKFQVNVHMGSARSAALCGGHKELMNVPRTSQGTDESVGANHPQGK